MFDENNVRQGMPGYSNKLVMIGDHLIEINGQNCQMVRIVVMYTSISFDETGPKHIVENFGNFAADFDLVCVSLCVCVCVFVLWVCVIWQASSEEISAKLQGEEHTLVELTFRRGHSVVNQFKVLVMRHNLNLTEYNSYRPGDLFLSEHWH
jgi:hypothetical protein